MWHLPQEHLDDFKHRTLWHLLCDISSILENEEDEENSEMVRVKEVYLEPMDLNEAIIRLENLGHSFYLFKDKEDGCVSVLYKRFDGGYGIIQGKE